MTESMVRSYCLPTTANIGKLKAVAEILPVWQEALENIQRATIRRLLDGNRDLSWGNTKALPKYLSQRQWKSVVNQVNGNMRSWRELAKIAFRKYVTNSSLSEEQKIVLYQINIRSAWWSKETQIGKLVVCERDLRLARQIIRRVLQRECPFPRLSKVRTMCMDGPIAQVEEGRNSKEYWVCISTLEKGKPVRIPLNTHAYFNADPGKLSNFCQVNVQDGIPTFTLIKSKPCVPLRENGEILGMDWGLSSLFATSNGDLLGRKLYPWLLRIDAQLTELTKQLQRNGIKPNSSKRYRRFQSRIRGYVKNEVGRVLNRLSEKDLKEICVEDLDFRGKGLSKRLNRIVSRAGRSSIKSKLKSIQEEKGILITSINPAYTSQECSGCGYVEKTNRKSQSQFKCRFCGKSLHADVNAARVIILRRSKGNEYAWLGKKKIKASLDDEFALRWGITVAEINLRCYEATQSRRLYSRATGASIAQLTNPAEVYYTSAGLDTVALLVLTRLFWILPTTLSPWPKIRTFF